jgi:hypothetical protein
MHRLRLTLAVCACAALALPAAAGARPLTRGFNATFPVASGLCARVANGHTPPRLAGSVAQVAAACATLKTSFTNAQNAYATTVAPLRQQARASIAARRAACRHAGGSAACATARAQTRALLASLRAQVRTAAQTYHASVDAARKTFWATIHALKGGASLPADKTVGPAPSTAVALA